jgi:hypothetical protein
MAQGRSAAFGSAPRKARTTPDSNEARGGVFASLQPGRGERRSQRRRDVSNSKSAVESARARTDDVTYASAASAEASRGRDRLRGYRHAGFPPLTASESMELAVSARS